jgi:hypothetical protein
LHFGFFNSRSIKSSGGSRSESRQQRRSRVAGPPRPVDFRALPMRAHAQRRTRSEATLLCCMLAAAGILFVSGALLGNAVSVLLSLFAALACVTRVEQKYRKGDYGVVEDESVD